VVQGKAHTWNRELLYEGVDEAGLIGALPHNVALELWLNLKNPLLLHPKEIGT
jgi:hypothetical protein